MAPIAALMLLLIAGAAADRDREPECKSWCRDSDNGCASMGYPEHECGACTETIGCHPGAKGFGPPTPQEEAETAMSAFIADLTACAALEAAVQKHVQYFWIQQDAERAFVRSLPTLCDVPAEGYHAALHALRAPMGDAINRHVRSAFFVKAACTAAADEVGNRFGESEVHTCNLPVLDHEPFNLLEGYYVVRLVNRLIREGPAALQCGLSAGLSGGGSATAAIVARWTRELEDVMAQHAANKRFDELWEHFKPECDKLASGNRPEVYTSRGRTATLRCGPRERDDAGLAPFSCAAARRAAPGAAQVSAGIDAALHAPATCTCYRVPGDNGVNLYGEDTPCTARHIAHVFGNDTLALLETVRRTAVAAYVGQPCPGAAARADQVRALEDATRERFEFAGKKRDFAPVGDTLFVSVTLGTVYHKIVPFCGPDGVREAHAAWQHARPGSYDDMKCAGHDEGNAGHHASPVTDIVPALDAARCGAKTCPAAASAVGALHELLQKITPLRKKLLELFFRVHKTNRPSHRQSIEGIFDRDNRLFDVAREHFAKIGPCAPALEQLVDDALALPPVLRSVLRDLHAAADAGALDASCVAGSRGATVELAPGTSAKLAAFVQDAAKIRVSRDAGGLPITVRMPATGARPASSTASARPTRRITQPPTSMTKKVALPARQDITRAPTGERSVMSPVTGLLVSLFVGVGFGLVVFFGLRFWGKALMAAAEPAPSVATKRGHLTRRRRRRRRRRQRRDRDQEYGEGSADEDEFSDCDLLLSSSRG